LTILDVMSRDDYFGPWFRAPSWDVWKAFLAGVFGLPMTAAQRALWEHLTQRPPPTSATRETVMICGRRSGKSRCAALIAVYLACCRDWEPYLSPGEVATIPVISADQKSSRTVMRYVKAFLEVPALRGRIVGKPLVQSVMLTPRVQIEVQTASFRAVRSYTVVTAICDEIAFWRTNEESANPDREIIQALTPAMASVPGSMLVILSSPYARKGVLWERYERCFGRDGPEVVCQADTRSMNPTIDQAFLDLEYEKDPASAAAEYGAEFRRDIESFVSREAVDAVVIPDRREVPARDALRYYAFVDPSGGSADSMTLAIAHSERGTAVLDCVREARPPFNPSEVVAEFCEVLRGYRVPSVSGDRYAGEWPRERFREHRVTYTPSERTKSELYGELLPLLNSGAVELLDCPRLSAQLCSLERRTARGGKDSIDHPPGGHDDLVNAAAGALVLVPRKAISAASRSQPRPWSDEFVRAWNQPLRR
jgi:hypothetical protein